MTPEAFQEARWLAVYGAYVALRVRQLDDLGAFYKIDMSLYVEEATAIANMVAVANGEPER